MTSQLQQKACAVLEARMATSEDRGSLFLLTDQIANIVPSSTPDLPSMLYGRLSWCSTTQNLKQLPSCVSFRNRVQKAVMERRRVKVVSIVSIVDMVVPGERKHILAKAHTLNQYLRNRLKRPSKG